MSIRVCIAGATGWAGSALAKGVLRATDMELVAAVSRGNAGKQLGVALGEPEATTPVFATAEEAARVGCDVFVEYTNPKAAVGNVRAALNAGAHVVIGTSGLTDEELAELGALGEAKGLGVLAVGNFAITVVLLQKFAEMAAKLVPHYEIIDYASASKPDAPSGTVRELAARLGAVRPPEHAVLPSETIGPPEVRGATLNGVQVHAVRLPGHVIGVEVMFGLPDQTLSLKAVGGPSAEPYVEGALMAVRGVRELRGLHRGLDAVMSI